jgi:hypothetical protein
MPITIKKPAEFRDVREDLTARLDALDGRLHARQAQAERDKKAIDDKLREDTAAINAERAVVKSMLEIENRRFGEPTPAAPKAPLDDFIVDTVKNYGPKEKEELAEMATKAGYFRDGKSPGRAVHLTLVNVLKGRRVVMVGPNKYAAPQTDLSLTGKLHS